MAEIDRSQLDPPAAQPRAGALELTRAQTPVGAGEDAPTVSAFTPVHGSTIVRTASITVDVTDGLGVLEHVSIWGVTASGDAFMVWNGSAFTALFDAGSSATGITDGTRFVIVHDSPGWPSASVVLHVVAVNPAGNKTPASGTFTISNGPAAPVIGSFSPADGGSTTRTGTITIDVTDDEGRTALVLVTIVAELSDGTTRAVYTGAAFAADFNAASARSDIANGYRYTIIAESPGWASETLAFRVVAVDTQGRITTSTTYNLTISDPPAPPDTTAPTVGNFSPAADTAITRSTALEFDVTDAGGLRKVLVLVLYATGAYEVAHDGDTFAPLFLSKSLRTNITDGSHYKLLRTGGWPAAPTVKIMAIDDAGNEP